MCLSVRRKHLCIIGKQVSVYPKDPMILGTIEAKTTINKEK